MPYCLVYDSTNNTFILTYDCSVMTPYYSEEAVYANSDLDMENEDGISIKFYLRKIFPGSNLPFSFPMYYFFYMHLNALIVLKFPSFR